MNEEIQPLINLNKMSVLEANLELKNEANFCAKNPGSVLRAANQAGQFWNSVLGPVLEPRFGFGPLVHAAKCLFESDDVGCVRFFGVI